MGKWRLGRVAAFFVSCAAITAGWAVAFSSGSGSGTRAPACPSSTATFRQDYGHRFPEWLLDRLEVMGYHCPTLVQQRSLDTILDGRDVLLHAQTGSGKTLAFLLPMLADVDPSRASVQGIVVVPTRELGLQVASVAKRLAGRSPMVMSVLEGSRNARQRAWASAAPPHIVIGNPDNLSALVESGAIKCHAVRMVVVDEVDACLASGANRKSLHELLSRHLSPTAALDGDDGVADPGGSGANAGQRGRRRLQHRQTVFASATVPQRRHFVRQCLSQQWSLTEPVEIQVHPNEAMPNTLSHFRLVCPAPKKMAALRALLRRELTGDARALVFCQPSRPMEAMAGAIDADLGSDQHAQELREDLNLAGRAGAVDGLRTGSVKVLITSDLSARGLDIPEVTHVINFDLPSTAEDYVHRGGRTGRLGRQGKIVSIVSDEEVFALGRLLNVVSVEARDIVG